MEEPVAHPEAASRRGELAERLLLPRHVAGDPDAFAELLGAWRAPVYGFLVRSGVAPAERDDLFQEVFLRIHRAASSYQPSRPLAPWLLAITANTVRSHFRAHQSRNRVFSPDPPAAAADPGPGPDRLLEGRETARALERALGELPLNQRHAVILGCIEGLDQREAAAALQVPLNTFKTHLRRARLALARALAAAHLAPGQAEQP